MSMNAPYSAQNEPNAGQIQKKAMVANSDMIGLEDLEGKASDQP